MASTSEGFVLSFYGGASHEGLALAELLGDQAPMSDLSISLNERRVALQGRTVSPSNPDTLFVIPPDTFGLVMGVVAEELSLSLSRIHIEHVVLNGIQQEISSHQGSAD